MFEDVILVHRATEKDGTSFSNEATEDHWILWQTCLRQIAVGTSASQLFVRKHDRVFKGVEAYQFIVEVACGLHSPVVGETEVMGQFKELVTRVEGLAQPAASLLQKFFAAALADTKFVRDVWLRDLGQRSYGSLLRKHVTGEPGLNIIGGGKLVREILPWLIGKTPKTTVYCRRAEQGVELQKEFSKIFAAHWPLKDQKPEDGAWVIAAPLTAAEIQDQLKSHSVHTIIDFRDRSESDPIRWSNRSKAVRVLRLNEFFKQIAGTHEDVKARADAAKGQIAELCMKRFRSAEIRPFGWEDLCG